MIFFPNQKITIKTEMNEKEFISKLNEVTDEFELFGWNLSDNYFLGEIKENKFKLRIANENYKPKDYNSKHLTLIKGEINANMINLKMGYSLGRYFYFIYLILFSFLYLDEISFNFKFIFVFAISIPFVISEFKSYSYYKENCNEIKRKFLEISEGKLCKES